MSAHNGTPQPKSALFPPAYLEELRGHYPLASAVREAVQLKRDGKRWKGLCPFHAERTPSFTVFPDNRFKCFGCGADGDVFAYVERRHGVKFPEAVEHVANAAGVPLPDTYAPRARPRPAPPPQPAKAPPAEREDWCPMVPPPADVPPPTAAQLRCDELHTYLGAQGEPLCYVRRFEAKGGERKRFVPLTYGTLKGRKGWHNRAPDASRPLYGLDRLAARPDAPVMVCEGEKPADAAQWLFPDMVCVAWPGGAEAAAKADWAPLAGRRTDKFMWPDNDAPGHAAAAKVAELLPGVRVLRVDDLPPGADAADVQPDHPEAWLRDRLPPEVASIADYLSTGWRTREFVPPVRLLGDLVTSTSRTFLVGATGLGKTMLGLAMAAGIATGTGFLDLKCDRPARVLYVDGEMPGELVRTRMEDALRRTGREDLSRNLFIYSVDEGEKFAAAYPQLGIMEPLNTEAGRSFIFRLIDAIGGVDAVIFDNVMSLIVGDQKDEVPWSETLPLVSGLTRRNIGQVWFDHAGHNADRQYGSSTKAWRFDAVGIMTALPEDERVPRETAFKLSFDAPGKARRRTPENWDQFAPRTIRLMDDRWAGHDVAPPASGDKGKPRELSSDEQGMLRQIFDLFADPSRPKVSVTPRPGMTVQRCVTRDELRAWLQECGRVGVTPGVTLTSNERVKLHRSLNKLRDMNKIGLSGHYAWLP